MSPGEAHQETFRRIAKLFLGIAASLFLIIFIADDAARPSDLVGGVPFAPGAEREDMPLGWGEKTVEHRAPFEREDLVVALDHLTYGVLSNAIREYSEEKGIKISVIDGTCGNSIGLLFRKQVDIGGLCCPAETYDRMPGLRFHTLGITPLAVIVHKDNPIEELTFRNLRKIYAGEIHHWSEINVQTSGKTWSHIVPVIRLHCRQRPGHWRILLDREDLFSAEIMEVGTIPDVISAVASSPSAIGLESLWLATDYYRDRWRVKTPRLDGMAPGDLGNLKSGEYPLYRVMSITLWEKDIAEKSLAYDLAMYMTKYIEREGGRFDVISSAELKKAGWKFHGRELVGEPE